MTSNASSLPLDATPFAVLDFETTGLSPAYGDRVVEVAVVKVLPGEEPQLVLDSLVDPQTHVRASSIHGIYDQDVIGAPTFAELAGPIAHALSGCVVGIFNASFDTRFLEAETRRSLRLEGFEAPPHVCLMYLRPALGLGRRLGLHAALEREGLPTPDHRAAHDAMASAFLWQRYRDLALAGGARRFEDLSPHRRYKFMESWSRAPLSPDDAAGIGPSTTRTALMPRLTPLSYPLGRFPQSPPLPSRASTDAAPAANARYAARAAYFRALIDAFSDGVVDGEEIASLRQLQASLGVTPGEVRAVHASFFGNFLGVAVEDDFVSHDESAMLRGVLTAMRYLGWAPGDLSGSAVAEAAQ